MREIKFRGLSQGKNKQWVYGWLEMFVNPMGKQPAVIHHFSDWNLNGSTSIDSTTVGQYTGIKDKNNKEIYEGDVLADTDELEACIHQIIWDKDKLAFNLLTLSDDEGNWDTGLYDDFSEYQIDGQTKYFEVIGNIYQNPELLSPILCA